MKLSSPVCSLFACTLLSVGAEAQIVFVNQAAAPGGDGLTWATAFNDLQDGLSASFTGAQIWVAAGTYKPTKELDPGDPRSASFRVRIDRHLYGGFDGTETTLDERAGLFDQTILSGELGGPEPYDNAYHVVYLLNAFVPPPTIDGFTIRGGVANGDAEHASGGGIHSFNTQVFVRNCTITENAAVNGGGVHAQPGFMGMENCTISNNRATNRGGGIWGQAINYKVVNSTISGNTCPTGGGIYVNSTASFEHQTLFQNCLIYDNVAYRGGAAWLGGSNITAARTWFVNCTIVYNRAAFIGGGLSANTNVAIPTLSFVSNSIVWDNWAPMQPNLKGRHVQAYSIIQDGYSGSLGMILSAPQFVDGPARDLRLAPTSVGIDAASNSLVARDYIDLDLDVDYLEPAPFAFGGTPRFKDDPATPDTGEGTGPISDIGAHER